MIKHELSVTSRLNARARQRPIESPETVLRWEKGRTPMGQTADRLVRTVAMRDPVSEYPLGLTKEVAQRSPKSLRVEMKIYDGNLIRRSPF